MIGAGVLGAGLGGYGLYKFGHINGQIKANKNLRSAFDDVKGAADNLKKYGDLASKISEDSSMAGRSARRSVENLSNVIHQEYFSDRSVNKDTKSKRERRNRIIRNSLIGIGALGGAAALGYGIYNRNKKLKGLKTGIDYFRDSVFDMNNKSRLMGNDLGNIDSNISSLRGYVSRFNDHTNDIRNKFEDNSRNIKKSLAKINELSGQLSKSK